MPTRRAWLPVPLLLALAILPPAGAENRIANGELDTDLAGWSDPGIGTPLVEWTADDHGTCEPDSGSGRILNASSETIFDISSASACATGIVPGAAYTLEGWLAFPSGETEDATGDLSLRWFSATDCENSSFLGNSAFTPQIFTTTLDEWIRVAIDPLVAPANAHSARARVRVTKWPASGSVHLYFDGIHLVRGAGYLFGDGFEVGSECRWVVAK